MVPTGKPNSCINSITTCSRILTKIYILGTSSFFYIHIYCHKLYMQHEYDSYFFLHHNNTLYTDTPIQIW